MAGPKNRAECVAWIVLQKLLPGVNIVYTGDQGQGAPGYELRLPDGTCSPLEVTTATCRAWRAFDAARRKHGERVPRRTGEAGWCVYPHTSANLKTLRERVDGFISELEKKGLRVFSYCRHAQQYPQLASEAESLGITVAALDESQGRGQIVIATPPRSWEIDSNATVDIIEREVLKEDNARKLSSGGCGSGHLFILVERDEFGAWLALQALPLPTRLPVTQVNGLTVWVAGLNSSGSECVIWQADLARGRWQSYTVPLTCPAPC